MNGFSHDDALTLLGSRIFFSTEAGAGGGGGNEDIDDEDGNKGKGGKGGSNLPDELPEDVLAQLQAAAEAKGGHEDFNKILYGDNKKLRDKNRELKTRVPQNGQVILSKKDSQELENYRKLGGYDDLKKKVESLPGLEKSVQETKRSGVISKAAEAHGYNSAVLRRLSDSDGVTIEMGEQTDGKDKKTVAYVVTKDKDDKETKVLLSKYAEDNWQDFSEALNKPGGNGSGGKKFVKQPAGGGKSDESSGPLANFRAKQQKRSSKGNALTGPKKE